MDGQRESVGEAVMQAETYAATLPSDLEHVDFRERLFKLLHSELRV